MSCEARIAIDRVDGRGFFIRQIRRGRDILTDGQTDFHLFSRLRETRLQRSTAIVVKRI